MVAVFRNDSFGLTANVRESGELFDVVVVDVLSGEEVLSTHRVGPEEGREICSTSHDRSAVRLRAGMQRS